MTDMLLSFATSCTVSNYGEYSLFQMQVYVTISLQFYDNSIFVILTVSFIWDPFVHLAPNLTLSSFPLYLFFIGPEVPPSTHYTSISLVFCGLDQVHGRLVA